MDQGEARPDAVGDRLGTNARPSNTTLPASTCRETPPLTRSERSALCGERGSPTGTGRRADSPVSRLATPRSAPFASSRTSGGARRTGSGLSPRSRVTRPYPAGGAREHDVADGRRCPCPALAVLTPRSFNAFAMAASWSALPPDPFRSPAGTFAANASAAAFTDCLPLACASARLVRFPASCPCALRTASAARVRSAISLRSFSGNRRVDVVGRTGQFAPQSPLR